MPNLSSQAGRAFDAGLASFAALSAGFVVFAMPQPLFSGLVEASRLGDLVAAARPPLGDTARYAATGAAALAAFVAVWALMAALDRIAPRRPAVAAAEAEAPRLRRADAHPDAPARRPLLARDLGEPLELEDRAEDPVEEPRLAEAAPRPLPAFLVPQQPEPAAEAEAEPIAETRPEAGPEPARDAEPEAIAALAAQLPEVEPQADQPLSKLVSRIEFGLSRKRQALPPADEPAAADEAEECARVGHRLRNAITDLQKIGSGGA